MLDPLSRPSNSICYIEPRQYGDLCHVCVFLNTALNYVHRSFFQRRLVDTEKLQQPLKPLSCTLHHHSL